ncbi:hypothetical protein [Labilithrix luteola]|nr:hypothetical protein [Labilithrix luteola]
MRAGRGSIATLAMAALLVAACGGSSSRANTPTAHVADHCPDMAKPDELSAFDFATEYALSHAAADKLKAAALATMEVSTLADKLDADLGIACAQIATDLGTKGDWRSGSDACAAAIKAVHDARAKVGSKATAKLVTIPPLCTVDASLMTKCASICDSSIPADRVKAECPLKAGRCDGNCDGNCEVKSAKCDGNCAGTCEGQVKGICGGRCRGTCDGKPSSSGCAGICVGTCDKGAINGECKGTCSGSCKAKAPGICNGICTGACTVELSDARCAGEFKTPDVSTDCRARCELAVMNQTECATPQVGLVFSGTLSGRERETAESMKNAVDRSFPSLLKILNELGDDAGKRVLNAQAVIEGARTGLKDMAMSGGASTAAASEAQLTKCFDAPFKAGAAQAGAVKAELDQALGVRDEVTK